MGPEAWGEQGNLVGGGVYRTAAFPTRAGTVEEVRAGQREEENVGGEGVH